MVTIRKQAAADGHFYEIDDFPAYRRALIADGIDVPETNYRIFISREHEMVLSEATGDWEQQIKRFYQLEPATSVPCEIVVSTAQPDGKPSNR